MFSYKRNFIRLNDKTVECIKSFYEHHLKPNCLDEVKTIYNCDVVLRAHGKLHFCQTVEEVDFEEISTENAAIIISE